MKARSATIPKSWKTLSMGSWAVREINIASLMVYSALSGSNYILGIYL